MMVYVVMGVSGCGKSTIGALLAERLGLPFFDADAFHPPANIHKMQVEKLPLNDDDRRPWLDRLRENIQVWNASEGAILACSALKEKYRAILGQGECLRWIYLQGTRDEILPRLQRRTQHFFDETLLESQFHDLEEPTDAIRVSIRESPEAIVKELLPRLTGERA